MNTFRIQWFGLKIFLWKKADLEKLQNDMQAFCQSFISKFSTSHPVDSLWTARKNCSLLVHFDFQRCCCVSMKYLEG
jgi:hypothetical protein